MILLKDNRITGISKELLKELNVPFDELGDLIDILKLKISSITDEKIDILNKSFKIKKIDLISLENIEIFELISINQNEKIEETPLESNNFIETEQSKISIPEPDLESHSIPENDIVIEESSSMPDIEISIPESSSTPDLDISISQPAPEPEPQSTPEPANDISMNPLSFEETSQPEIDIPTASPIEENNLNIEPNNIETSIEMPESKPELDISIPESSSTPDLDISISQPAPEPESQSTPEPANNISMNPLSFEETSQPEIDIPTASPIEETQKEATIEENPLENNNLINSSEENELEPIKKEETQSQTEQTEEIELVFEDKLDDIKKLLENSKELKANISNELHKVSEELGIDEEMAKDLYKDLLSQIRKEKNTFYKLIEKSDYENLHKTAHKLKGAALNLRISSLALILKTLDELSKEKKPIEDIKYAVNSFYQILDELENIKKKKENNSEYDIKLDDVTKETLREYVALGDEEKFQKEKKFIEQLLGIKIKNLEEAKKIIKAR